MHAIGVFIFRASSLRLHKSVLCSCRSTLSPQGIRYMAYSQQKRIISIIWGTVFIFLFAQQNMKAQLSPFCPLPRTTLCAIYRFSFSLLLTYFVQFYVKHGDIWFKKRSNYSRCAKSKKRAKLKRCKAFQTNMTVQKEHTLNGMGTMFSVWYCVCIVSVAQNPRSNKTTCRVYLTNNNRRKKTLCCLMLVFSFHWAIEFSLRVR